MFGPAPLARSAGTSSNAQTNAPKQTVWVFGLILIPSLPEPVVSCVTFAQPYKGPIAQFECGAITSIAKTKVGGDCPGAADPSAAMVFTTPPALLIFCSSAEAAAGPASRASQC